MRLLRIYASLVDPPLSCQWCLITDRQESISGEGRLADLPQRADRVHLVIPAAQVLLTRARIPRGARRGSGALLAFAVEEKVAGEADASEVSWLGSVDGEDALAVVDRAGLARWRQALGEIGLRVDAVHCETLLLPLRAGEWSVAWNGTEGFVRSAEFEGAATDCGDRDSPPMCLRLLLDEAKSRNSAPTAIALYAPRPDVAPDLAAWQRELGVVLRLAGAADWRTAPADAGVCLTQPRQGWSFPAGVALRLRPAAWLVAAALALHAVALIGDWTHLASEQRVLRQQMDARFRSTFPDAVAVVDPPLQMRRKLAEAHHAAGLPDSSDFLPLVERVAAAAKELPARTLRSVSYAGGRMTLTLAANDAAAVQRFEARLRQSGLGVERAAGATVTAGAALILVVGPS